MPQMRSLLNMHGLATTRMGVSCTICHPSLTWWVLRDQNPRCVPFQGCTDSARPEWARYGFARICLVSHGSGRVRTALGGFARLWGGFRRLWEDSHESGMDSHGSSGVDSHCSSWNRTAHGVDSHGPGWIHTALGWIHTALRGFTRPWGWLRKDRSGFAWSGVDSHGSESGFACY